MSSIDHMEYVRVIVSAVGVLINGAVLYKAAVVLDGLRARGINGQTRRDARWGFWDDSTLTLMQIVIFAWGTWLVYMPTPRPEVAEHLEVSCWMIVGLSILISSMGLRNLWLRHLQYAEYQERHQSKPHTHSRATDELSGL